MADSFLLQSKAIVFFILTNYLFVFAHQFTNVRSAYFALYLSHVDIKINNIDVSSRIEAFDFIGKFEYCLFYE